MGSLLLRARAQKKKNEPEQVLMALRVFTPSKAQLEDTPKWTDFVRMNLTAVLLLRLFLPV